MLGVEVGTFSGYERAYRTPETKTLEQLADLTAFRLTIYWGGTSRGWKDSPPQEIELEQFIREHPNRGFRRPLSEDVKDDVMLALKQPGRY